MRISGFILLLPVVALADASWTFDDADAIAMYQDGGNTIKDETATREVTPRLEFRCEPMDQTITARIDWQRFISAFSTEVGFKVDGGKFTWLKWKVDGSEQVTYSPSPADTQKLIDALVTGSELLVDVTPYSEGPVTTTYDLTTPARLRYPGARA
jgi:hypothetical protein